MFSSKAIAFCVATYFFAQGQAIAIGERTPEGLQVRQIETFGNGTLTWYDGTDLDDGSVAARDTGCGANAIKCANNHVYDGNLCQQLFSALNTNNYISASPRAVCYGQGDDACCISWSKYTALSLQAKNLLPSAQRTLSMCGSMGGVSGQEWNVLLSGTCVSQCLSNRATGCN
ncbi:hypothetical protein GQ53DRAFT_878825 [Thozetella sp. PMI_491]|nr:hypothetical protein GQ53DRAFT_878825 [Thozetella sp. PMI_491]